MEQLKQEQLRVLVLDTRMGTLENVMVYQGAMNNSSIRPAKILRPAVLANAPNIIVAHNHPSGDPQPSPEDIAATRDIRAAGKLPDIELLDHIVIGANGRFASMKEKGPGFGRSRGPTLASPRPTVSGANDCATNWQFAVPPSTKAETYTQNLRTPANQMVTPFIAKRKIRSQLTNPHADGHGQALDDARAVTRPCAKQ